MRLYLSVLVLLISLCYDSTAQTYYAESSSKNLSYNNFFSSALNPNRNYDAYTNFALNSYLDDSVSKQNKLDQFMKGLEWYMKYFPIPYLSGSVATIMKVT